MKYSKIFETVNEWENIIVIFSFEVFSRTWILFYAKSYVSINLKFTTLTPRVNHTFLLRDIFSFEIIIFGWWTKMWKYKCERDDSPIRRSNDTVESIPKAETRRNAINSTHSRNIPVTRIMIFWLGYLVEERKVIWIGVSCRYRGSDGNRFSND